MSLTLIDIPYYWNQGSYKHTHQKYINKDQVSAMLCTLCHDDGGRSNSWNTLKSDRNDDCGAMIDSYPCAVTLCVMKGSLALGLRVTGKLATAW